MASAGLLGRSVTTSLVVPNRPPSISEDHDDGGYFVTAFVTVVNRYRVTGFPTCGKSCSLLFVTQGGDGFHARGAHCRNPARNHGRAEQHHGDGRECLHIPRADSDE